MRTTHKSVLLAGTAAGLLGFGLSGLALAFDGVNWDWTSTIAERATINSTVTTNLAPSGLDQLEKMQVYVGDMSADSEVHGVNNIQPIQATDGTIDFTVDWSGKYSEGYPHPFGTGVIGGTQATLGGDLSGSGDISGKLSEDANTLGFTATFTDIPVSIPASQSYDALTELPSVASSAAAIGNNQSITSVVGTALHDAQFVFGGFSGGDGVAGVPSMGPVGYMPNFESNTGLSGILAFALAGEAGVITPADIKATSNVSDIVNATVDSSATAVANNVNVEVNPATTGDQYVVGDFVQGALANVSATSTVNNVTLSHYANLGALDRPIVNSAATAVGNNVSIKINTPTVP